MPRLTDANHILTRACACISNMECPVCLNNWEEYEYTPLLLVCGHSLCCQCVFSLITGNGLLCPSCNQQHSFEIPKSTDGDLSKYKKLCIKTMTRNMTLLSLMTSQPPELQPDTKQISSGRTYSKGHRCLDHHELVVCYTERPFSFLCPFCIEEVKHMNLQVKPIPEVVDLLHANLKATLGGFARKRQDLQTSLQEMERVRLEPIEYFNSRIDQHYSTLQTVLNKASRELQDFLTNRIESNLHDYSSKLDTVYTLQAELEDEEDRIIRIMAQSPAELASRHIEAGNILSKAMRPFPEVDASDETFKVRIKPEAYEEFSSQVKESCPLSVVGPEVWVCRNCVEENPASEYRCEACQSFRSPDTFLNLMTKPERASAREIGEINSRRQAELQVISELDNSADMGEWYLINTDWITQWKCFVFNKSSPFPKQNSPNKAIGVLPPGQISNHELFIDPLNPVTLRSQLKVVANYRGVNQSVWKAYFKFYGGGPVIVRSKLNIYEKREQALQRAVSSVL